MKVALEDVERELSKMWEDEAKKSQASRVEILTLVALVSEPRLYERAKEVLAQVVAVHPSRTISAVWHPGKRSAAPSIVADVMLHRSRVNGPERSQEACGDAIALEAFGAAREWLPENVDRLALSDLPLCVWWVGDLPDYDDLFDRMVRRADVVLVSSSEMDLRDLEKLAQISQASKGTHALLDLTWIRLRGIQDLVARFFDDPTTRPYLDRIKKIHLMYSPRPNETDAASTRVGLFLGWMGATLGFRPETVKWHRDPRGGDLTIERTGSPGPIAIRIDQERREGVHDGAITHFQMECEGPDGAAAQFTLARGDEPQLVVWSCEGPGITLPKQTMRLGQHDEAKLLARQLDKPARDPLFEASVGVGARIVQPVAPRLSAPPPPPRPRG